ncbi:isochorismatase family protein [Streptomyces sp. NPDC047024]|uniref:isochorismatase family protein n=1 Tax=Streptomyces sp. NPDC047024 TaxID=3155476 RepID=UPI00340E3E8E
MPFPFPETVTPSGAIPSAAAVPLAESAQLPDVAAVSAPHGTSEAARCPDGTAAVPYGTPEPGGGPSWCLEVRRAVLLVRDIRGCPVEDGSEFVAHIERLVRAARDAGVPVVYAVRVSEQGAIQPGHGVVDTVQPRPGDSLFTGKRCSAFAGTRLRARLTELGRDQLVVAGVAAATDILLTAADAWMQDLEPFVAADAVTDRTAAEHAMAVRWLAATCAVIADTDALVAAFGGYDTVGRAPVERWADTPG